MTPETAFKLFDDCVGMTLGCRSFFLSKLLSWQKSFGIENSSIVPRGQTNGGPLSTSSPISSTETQSQESAVTQKSKKESALIFANVLKNAGQAGKHILQYYDKHKKLNDQIRKDMTDIIVRFAFDNNFNFSPANTISIIKQIIQTFPSESEVCMF